MRRMLGREGWGEGGGESRERGARGMRFMWGIVMEEVVGGQGWWFAYPMRTSLSSDLRRHRSDGQRVALRRAAAILHWGLGRITAAFRRHRLPGLGGQKRAVSKRPSWVG